MADRDTKKIAGCSRFAAANLEHSADSTARLYSVQRDSVDHVSEHLSTMSPVYTPLLRRGNNKINAIARESSVCLDECHRSSGCRNTSHLQYLSHRALRCDRQRSCGP